MPKQHSVKRDVKSFCGWDFLLRFIKKTPAHHRRLISAVFETGGRISAVLTLTKEHFDLSTSPELVIVRNMKLIKRYEVVKKIADTSRASGFRWKTKLLDEYRTFPIRKDEPLVPYLLEDLKRPGPLFRFTRTAAYLLMRRIGKRLNEQVPNARIHSSQLYPHFFRSERACQLVDDYGFDITELDHFFGWRSGSMKTAEIYARMGWRGLARVMGVKL